MIATREFFEALLRVITPRLNRHKKGNPFALMKRSLLLLATFLVLGFCSFLHSQPQPKSTDPVLLGERPPPADLKDLSSLTASISGATRLVYLKGYHVSWDVEDAQVFDAYATSEPEQARMRRLTQVTFLPRQLLSRRPNAEVTVGELWGAYSSERQTVVQVLPKDQSEWKTAKNLDGDYNPIVLKGEMSNELIVDVVDFVRSNEDIKSRAALYAKNMYSYPAARVQSIAPLTPTQVAVTLRTGDENGFTVTLEKSGENWTTVRTVDWVPSFS